MTVDILLGTSTKMPLGGLDLDSIRLKDSKEYRFSQSQALDLIGKHRSQLSVMKSRTPDKAQTLTDNGFTWVTVPVKFHDGKQYRTALTLSLSDVAILWFCETVWGNATAAQYTKLLMQDSLADRCDQAWGESRGKEARQERDYRFLSIPEPWSEMFDKELEFHLERLSGLHKLDIRNGKLYWKFFYRWVKPSERVQMDIDNPVQPNGRRKYKLHQFLSAEAKERMQKNVQAMFVLMKQARSLTEWEDSINRYEGFDQMDFDFDYETAA